MNPHSKGLGLAGLLALPIVATDQIAKGLAVAAFAPGGSRIVVPGLLHLTYSENPGAAFGLLREAPPVVMLLLVLAVVGVFIALVWPFLGTRVGVGIGALVLGGAIGNLVDRVIRQHVIDYVEIPIRVTVGGQQYAWPIFNLADVCVVIGIGLLVVLLFRHTHTETSAPAPAAEKEETA